MIVRCDYRPNPNIDNQSVIKNPLWGFLTFFPKRLGIFSPNFTRLLYVPIYIKLQIFIQLSPTVTKLCHIKCDHAVCVLADGGQFTPCAQNVHHRPKHTLAFSDSSWTIKTWPDTLNLQQSKNRWRKDKNCLVNSAFYPTPDSKTTTSFKVQ